MFAMKKTIGCLVTAVGLSMFTTGAYAHCGETALAGNMNDLKTDLKSLSFDLRSDDAAAAGERVDDIIAVLREARGQTPYLFKEKGLKGDELEKRLTQFQSVIDETIDVFVAVDAAIAEGNMSEAKTLLREAGNMRKKGHRSFKADC